MYRVHTLPTESTKDATTEESGGRPTRSVEDSLVLLQALRQSRQTWLTSAFVKFSTKSRGGKGSEIWQPPHTIRFRGKCDLEIGPHVFYATSVYEVTYQPYQAPVQAPSPYYVPAGAKFPGWSASPYTYSSATPTPSTSQTGAVAHVYTPSTPALVSSIKGAVPVTNDLISQVNTAAVTNPTLANLLGLAASGSATPEQLQTLGVTIQSLAETALKSTNSTLAASSVSTPSSKAAPAPQPKPPIPPPQFQPPSTTQSSKTSPSTSSQQPVLSLRPSQAPSTNPTPIQQEQTGSQAPTPQYSQPLRMQTINKEPDVVIEFYENSYDRWTLPKDLVLYERVKRWDGSSSLADIIFSTIFPFEGLKASSPPVTQTPSLPVGSPAEPPPQTKEAVHPITLRFFNVPPAIWNLFSKAADDEERTKRVRASMDAQLDNAASRVYLQHRIAEGTLLTQLQASANDRYPTKTIRPAVSTTNSTHAKRRAPGSTKNSKEGTPTGAPPPKRKRAIPAKKPEPKTGKCEGCLRSPVSLVPDTPYCPTCDKAKKANVSSMGPSAGGITAQTGSIPPKSTAQSTPAGNAKQPATQPTQTQYAARHPVQGYYAWQNQPHYVYQFQPQSQGQPQNASQPTSAGGIGQATGSPSQSTPSQPPGQPTPSQQPSTPSELGSTPLAPKINNKPETK